MADGKREPVLVVLQLSGGNDFLNTIVPYDNGIYHDSRPTVGLDGNQVIQIDDEIGFHPNMDPLSQLYHEGKLALIQGIGYPNQNRSHFRGMDIWHTCKPETIATEGWLGKVIRDLDRCPAPPGGSVVTMGNYDGVHRGHRAVIGALTERVRQGGGATALVTYEPHTLRVINPERAPRLLPPTARTLEPSRTRRSNLPVEVMTSSPTYGAYGPTNGTYTMLSAVASGSAPLLNPAGSTRHAGLPPKPMPNTMA